MGPTNSVERSDPGIGSEVDIRRSASNVHPHIGKVRRDIGTRRKRIRKVVQSKQGRSGRGRREEKMPVRRGIDIESRIDPNEIRSRRRKRQHLSEILRSDGKVVRTGKRISRSVLKFSDVCGSCIELDYGIHDLVPFRGGQNVSASRSVGNGKTGRKGGVTVI